MALSILKPLLWLEEVSKEIEALQSYTCDEYKIFFLVEKTKNN